ncbi:hypothetical protein JVT61DRAFT_897 [Boletus reticuloceps]|uniref:Uncharacterized protein n=1 Tax=Boletus reticuloceps TaxID=495285 RepID=A0A8I2YRL0_9AGAM|nr:hypothetical protein JVT61DRAFT_897 [Boletus reticuloceps]
MQVGGGNISSSYSWDTTHALDWRVGPSDQYYNGIPNQSVFIQGFKIAVRSSILGSKRVTVKADMPAVRPLQITFYGGSRWSNVGARLSSGRFSGLAADIPRETDAESDMDMSDGRSDSSSILDDAGEEDIAIQHIPQVSKPFHPCDIINQYLLRSHPSVAVAITHDTQWTALLERELLKPEEIVQEDRLEALVRDMLPVFQEGAVYLQNTTADDNADSNASDDEIVDAQMEISTPFIEEREFDIQTEVPETSFGNVIQESPQSDAMAIKPRAALNAPVIEVRSDDSYERKSSRVNPPSGPVVPQMFIGEFPSPFGEFDGPDYQVMKPPEQEPLVFPHLPNLDKMYSLETPNTPFIDSPSASPSNRMVAPPPFTKRKSTATGTRKNITPGSLVPVDTPTQSRKYVTPPISARASRC